MLPDLPDPARDPRTWGDVDGPTLLAAASALQLDPANVASLFSLRRLATVAAELPARPSARRLSSSKLKSLLAVRGVGDAATSGFQDPYEGLLVVEVPYYGGPHLVMQGMATHCGRVAEFVLTSIMSAPDGTFPRPFLAKVRALATILLGVSDRVCRRASVDRWSVPGADHTRVLVPSAGTLEERSQWVKVDEEELFAGFPGVAREYLSTALIREQGTPTPAAVEDRSEWSMVQPFVRFGTTLTVVAPPDLAVALRHQIVRAAMEEHCTEHLVQAMLEHSVAKAEDLLSGIVDEPFTVTKEGPNWARLQARFDTDKLMDLFVIVDDLVDYDPSSAYGTWDAAELMDELVARAETGDRVLRVFLPTVIGRDLAVGIHLPSEPTPTLFAGWDDLQTILQTPHLGALGLWYFARAQLHLHARTEIMSFSTVDTFELYRERGMSFYLSDDAMPQFLNVPVAYGQDLRIANAFRHDRRFILKHDGDGYCEAWATHGRDSSRVYLARVREGAAFVADLDDAMVWVRIPRRRSGESVPAETLLVAAEATAYWVWQLWVEEPDLLRRASNDLGVVDVVVRGTAPDDPDHPWVQVTEHDGVYNVEVSLTSQRERGGQAGAQAPENQVDRELVGQLIQALGGNDISLLERVVPPGPKGMIHLTDSRATTGWAQSHAPAWTGSEALVAELLDGLGLHLTEDVGMRVGLISDDQRVPVLTGHVVTWLIDRLRDQIAELAGDGLAELLVGRSEALIAYHAREAERLPAQIACFGPASDQARQIQRQLSQSSDVSLSSRFLVELASAFPPEGENPLTEERYDRMLALASEIVNKGMLVDSLRPGITDVQLSILPSGRLGTDREGDAYVHAVQMFSQFRAQNVLDDATGARPGAPSAPWDAQEADRLAKESFGFTYTELFGAASVLIDLLGDEQTLTVQREHLERELHTGLGWSEEGVSRVLDSLTLSPFTGTFEQFWEDLTNVAPWRFNRDRSYLKRPLVQVGDDVAFGRRVLEHAPVYWVELYRTGRLRATGKIAGAMSRQRNAKGRAFEQDVAELLKGLGYSPVKERLRRVGSHDFRNINGRDLGDIDVVAVHRGRQELLLIEAKDLEVARTPTELRNEINQLIGEGNSAINRLAERATWVRAHLSGVLAELGVTDLATVIVRPVVVVKQPLLSEHMKLSATIPVVAVSRLAVHLAGLPPKR